MPDDLAIAGRNIVFYDGECALCHGFVRFLLRRDVGREQFLFSPLRGQLIVRLLTEDDRAALPDSLVLVTADRMIRTRSQAVLRSLELLGGFWSAVATTFRVVPDRARDAVYDFVARLRRRLFGGTAYSCPLVPSELRDRFVD
jgi:predicted DCC family thiol-disulfide oxidoreductase YuxK